jgi:pyruvate dehydrogenase E1 component
MYTDQEDVFYYITLMNENYQQPAMPEGAEEGIVKGMYLFREGTSSNPDAPRIQLLGSGTILREAIAAADLLEQDWNVAADVWSVPSFTELGRDGMATLRWNMLHPDQEPRESYVEAQLASRPDGPVVAATDYLRAFADQIRPYVKRRYHVLGTDGFGRSDYRRKLREFFEVNRHFIAVAALSELAAEGSVPASAASEAITKYGINPDKPDPAHA